MDEEVQLGGGATGKIRDFWTGVALAAATLGLYELWWYYRLNAELRAIGVLVDDRRLARTLPELSVTALVAGLLLRLPGDSWLYIAVGFAALAVSLVSQHRFGCRIRRAEELVGVPKRDRFKRWSILLLFPGGLLLIPYFIWFANVTRHQSELMEIRAHLARDRVPEAA